MSKKTTPITDLRKLDETELAKELAATKLHAQELVGKLATGKLKNIQEISRTRKTVARIATVLNEKALLKEAANANI
jgi:ribosomal protein L29